MKKILTLLLIAISFTASAQFADPIISILTVPPVVPLNTNTALQVDAGNTGQSPIVANSLRITITVGSNAQILGVDAPTSDPRWVLESLTVGPANTLILKNNATINTFDINTINIIIQGVVQGGPFSISGIIGYIPGPNPLLGGAFSSSQGDNVTENNSSNTSLTVTAVSCIPSLQATMGAFTNNTTGSGLTVNWTRGNGTGGVVVIGRLTATSNADPSNGNTYTANSNFGSGSTTGSGNFVVYKGTGTSVDVTGLTCNSNYTFTVYEYNSGGNCYAVPGSSSSVIASYSTINSGNWSNPQIWPCGIIPTSNDSVVIPSGKTIVLDITTQIRKLNIQNGATISIVDPAVVFTVGSASTKTSPVLCDGSLTINNGTIKINGNLTLMGNSVFNFTGGNLIIDGNTGLATSSIPDGQHLFNVFSSAPNFSFTGGKLQFINPPLGASSQAINCPRNFGPLSVSYFGDGVSTISSNNPNGFGGNLLPAQIGKFNLDAATTGNNRVFKNLNPLLIQNECNVWSGNLIQGALLNVQ